MSLGALLDWLILVVPRVLGFCSSGTQTLEQTIPAEIRFVNSTTALTLLPKTLIFKKAFISV